MKQQNYFWFGVLVVLVLILIFINSGETRELGRVCISGECVRVVVAESLAERQQGLMDVAAMNDDEGMLFVFEENGVHSFWMKDTLISLDIIWISEDFEIIDIQQAEPCEEDPCEVYTPSREAKYVLEVNAGWSREKGVGIGDFVKLQ